MNKKLLVENIYKKKSFLCVGLDPDIDKFPISILQDDDPIFSFNKKIIDVTKDYCVSYKLNLAFYLTQTEVFKRKLKLNKLEMRQIK